MRIYRTGINALDDHLNGGIPGGSIITIFEEPGSGGDIFTFHFALEGVKNRENVLYISTDDTIEETKEYFNLYFRNPKNLFDNLTILSLFSPQISEGIEFKEDLKSFIRRVIYDPISSLQIILENEMFDRIIINNFIYFIENYELQDVSDFLIKLSKYSKKTNSVLLNLMTKGIYEQSIENKIKHHSTGVFELSTKEVENEIQRRFKILKLKKALVPKTIKNYEITEKGIKMDSLIKI
jgi:KaiC/GvpD/RAD55 family RecA-like ATPase